MDTQEAAKETRTQAVRNQWERLERYRILNEKVKKGEILFTGSSLMEQFPIDELRMTEEMDAVIYNRGIGGFTTEDMLQCMEEMVFGTEPGKIFINIGTNDEWGRGMFATRNNENIRTANEAVKGLAEKMGCRYIDVNQGLTDENGRLKKAYTVEGIHMYANGYRVVLENLRKYL